MAELSPVKRGRPRRKEGIKHITFKNSTYETWKLKKASMGMSGLDNSQFAEVLLHRVSNSCEEDDAERTDETADSRERAPPAKRRKRLALAFSTPVAKANDEPAGVLCDFSPIEYGETSGSGKLTERSSTDYEAGVTQGLNNRSSFLSDQMHGMNPLYASLAGDPFDEVDMSSESGSSCGQSSDHSVVDVAESDSDLEDEYRSEEEEENEQTIFSEDVPDDSATRTSLELETDEANQSQPQEQPPQEHYSVEQPPQGQHPQEQPPQGLGCKSFAEYHEEMKLKLEEEFTKLNRVKKEIENCAKLLDTRRVICEVPMLIELFSGKCPSKGCTHERKVVHKNMMSGVISLSYACPVGHCGVWHSSSILGRKRGQNLYVISTLLSAGTLITGNNFEKLELMFKILNCEFVSKSTANRLQSLYVEPAVEDFWSRLRGMLFNLYKDNTMVLCGDGRMDSPGFSAKYCTYVIMEHHIGTVLDIEVIDKRETGGASTNMERLGLKRLLERLIHQLLIGELTTDASATIAKLVRDLKELHPDQMGFLFHSLDIWHKSCKLTAKLTTAAKIKGNDCITEWIEPIRNHFWHCAEIARGNADTLKDAWLGVIHHVCGEHEWSEGSCAHGPLTEVEQQKTYLDQGSKAFKAIQDIVFDRQWLDTLKYYVHFRHTSRLESFNSMLLKYAPKRNAFSYEAYTARMQLAAIDHNLHILRPIIPGRFKRIYSKRAKHWHVVPVKEAKTYPYWTALCADVLQRRLDDVGPVSRPMEIAANHPLNIAPNIAMRPAPSTADLAQARLSRFQKQPSGN